METSRLKEGAKLVLAILAGELVVSDDVGGDEGGGEAVYVKNNHFGLPTSRGYRQQYSDADQIELRRRRSLGVQRLVLYTIMYNPATSVSMEDILCWKSCESRSDSSILT